MVDPGPQAEGALSLIIAERFQGRFRPGDIAIVTVGGPEPMIQLRVRLYNFKGQFVTRARAEAFTAEMGWTDALVVLRDSQADRDLRDYGTRELVR